MTIEDLQRQLQKYVEDEEKAEWPPQRRSQITNGYKGPSGARNHLNVDFQRVKNATGRDRYLTRRGLSPVDDSASLPEPACWMPMPHTSRN